jgi:hypothetical protein
MAYLSRGPFYTAPLHPDLTTCTQFRLAQALPEHNYSVVRGVCLYHNICIFITSVSHSSYILKFGSWVTAQWTHTMHSVMYVVMFHPFIGYKDPLGEKSYSSTLFLTSALEGMRGQHHAPAANYPWERPGTHCTGGWVGLRAGLDRRGKSRPQRDSIPGPSSL